MRLAGDAPAFAPRPPYKDKRAPRSQQEWSPAERPQADSPQPERPRPERPRPAARADGPHYKVRTDDGRKLDAPPARDSTPPADARPRPPKSNPKDKGKPKYKNRTPRADAGATARKVKGKRPAMP